MDRVDPVVTASEKKAWLALPPEGRAAFEQAFWANKGIAGDEYFRRADYIDSTFGSGKTGSGARTDQGRVWLSLGAPTRVMHLPSSRVFVPLDIWYYDVIPGVIDTEVRLIFFRPNSQGLPKLYSPQTDTIRALLVPQSATRSMFGPNDGVTESDIRQKLLVGPVEDEVVSAAVHVATGVFGNGNEEILGRISSPGEMLGKPQKASVNSRLITGRLKMDVMQTRSAFAETQVDFHIESLAQKEISFEVLQGSATIYQNRLSLRFPAAKAITYTHRLDLLPGSYRVLFTADGKPSVSALDVGELPALGRIERGDWNTVSGSRSTPFEFDGQQLDLNPDGRYAVMPLAQPGKVRWTLRSSSEVIWRSTSEGQSLASVVLPGKGIPAGSYKLEGITDSGSRSMDIVVGATAKRDSDNSSDAPEASAISFNANLTPSLRQAFIGHQWLLRNQFTKAQASLEASLHAGVTEDAQIELARVDAFSGNLDAARDRVRAVLAVHPASFEALSVLAYIEAGFQDYVASANLYRQALAIQDSPALRAALAKLPVQLSQSQ